MPSTAGRTNCAPQRRWDSSTDGGSPPGLAAVDRGTGFECGDAQERKESAPDAPPPTAVSPATAWDAAERTKHMARYRREEMKIQAWENWRRQKAELQMKTTEAKAERMKRRTQEKMVSKMASAQAAAREKRA
ncbi:unnamed protein product [Miscanthus lutarioriparius]|uniref:Remorin C-terminal domain-containing protein n=1 Tax=Miscanthus lutarioriparius TaxID=422564 RepID=A0A811PKQ2_9POAL|nr:unnamed protein product [Miscanthus lutarioriparius]